jgi:hypothetical protein
MLVRATFVAEIVENPSANGFAALPGIGPHGRRGRLAVADVIH